MIQMPTAYKQSMAQNFRNRSHMSVVVGIINQLAQDSASLSNDFGCAYSYLTNGEKPFQSFVPDMEYATFEDSWWKADGSMYFPPKMPNIIYNQGILTNLVNGGVCVEFDKEYDIRGLTIDFGRNYPTSFTVTNGTVTHTYSNNKEVWSTDDIYEDTQYFYITVSSFVTSGNERLRIRYINMGVGVTFGDSKIISCTHKDYVSPITENIPTVDFTLKAENVDRLFDVENVESAIHYLETGQEVSVKYGYEVTPGQTTWIDGAVLNLSGWEADDLTVSFTAKDKLDSLDGIYYKGVYEPLTAYDLAVSILTDAGLDSWEYSLDNYLDDVTINNPMPPVTHREALQILANACRCKLFTDRHGIITIKPAFDTQLAPERMQVTSSTAAEFSNLHSLIDGSTEYEFATFANFAADGHTYFLPKDGNYLNTGFVSEEVSDGSGLFATNPSFTIQMEATASYYSLQLNFASFPPEEVVITAYNGSTLAASTTVQDLELQNTIEYAFTDFDSITFEFTEAQPYTRIYVESVIFGDVSDYLMSYRLMFSSPNGIQQEKVKQLNVIENIYSEGEDTTLFDATVELDGNFGYTVYFDEPVIPPFTATVNGTDVQILDSSAYSITVKTSGITGASAVKIAGKHAIINKKPYVLSLNDTGKIEEWDNPLINGNPQLLAEWIAEYFKNNVEYSISYRGEPCLEASDIIYLQNKYVENLQIRIYEHTLEFNGALRGSVKAHRAMEV